MCPLHLAFGFCVLLRAVVPNTRTSDGTCVFLECIQHVQVGKDDRGGVSLPYRCLLASWASFQLVIGGRFNSFGCEATDGQHCISCGLRPSAVPLARRSATVA